MFIVRPSNVRAGKDAVIIELISGRSQAYLTRTTESIETRRRAKFLRVVETELLPGRARKKTPERTTVKTAYFAVETMNDFLAHTSKYTCGGPN